MEEVFMGDIHKWVIRHQEGIDKFTAEYLPRYIQGKGGRFETDDPKLPEFIKMSVREEKVYLKTKMRDGGEGAEFFVNMKVFANVDEKSPVKCEESSRYRYYLYKVWEDKEQRLAFIGLVLATLGILIDASFDIGKTYPLIEDKYNLFVAAKILSWFLKVIGLGLVFWKGFISAK
jgi:hypothetical protein